MRLLYWIPFFGLILFYLFFYIEFCISELGRETGIIWLCGSLVLSSLPFFVMDRYIKKRQKPFKKE